MKDDGCPPAITDLRDRLEPWVTWWRTCLDCGFNYVSVEQTGTVPFCECKKCGKLRTVRTAPADQ